jgi:glutamine synthetase
MEKHIVEYIWIDGDSNLRSKNKIIDLSQIVGLDSFSDWNYDGSSTNQATTESSERFLKPVYYCINPFVSKKFKGYLVLCATYDDLEYMKPTKNNNFDNCYNILENEKNKLTKPWFGFEQEFFLFKHKNTNCSKIPLCGDTYNEQGQYYCSIGCENAFGRHIIDQFIEYCIVSGLDIYGSNSEVAPSQWEFQIGTTEGISAAHQLWIARYILIRIAEKYDVCVDFHPKPHIEINGSGCHTNFSNQLTRNTAFGFENMKKMFQQLEEHHKEHISFYGEHNELRLTGIHETASFENFSWGVSSRNTSIRVGTDVAKNGHGYFEDRRPASNCDPYLVIGLLVKNTSLDFN